MDRLSLPGGGSSWDEEFPGRVQAGQALRRAGLGLHERQERAQPHQCPHPEQVSPVYTQTKNAYLFIWRCRNPTWSRDRDAIWNVRIIYKHYVRYSHNRQTTYAMYADTINKEGNKNPPLTFSVSFFLPPPFKFEDNIFLFYSMLSFGVNRVQKCRPVKEVIFIYQKIRPSGHATKYAKPCRQARHCRKKQPDFDVLGIRNRFAKVVSAKAPKSFCVLYNVLH